MTFLLKMWVKYLTETHLIILFILLIFLDVVIPTNSPDKTSIVLKAGQRVMVLKSPKGIYMQLETGKIIAIRTAFKVGQGQDKSDDKKSKL